MIKRIQKTVAVSLFFLISGFVLTGCKKNETNSEESAVASSEEMATPVEILEEDMVPIKGTDLKDGTYQIKVDSSSSMFQVEACQLEVKKGKMTATMTMSGTGYLKVYMGTGVEAVNVSEKEYIPYKENENGQHTYQVPVEALNKALDCTAFSTRKEKWYDRVLVFRADSLPIEAISEDLLTKMESLELENGMYTIDVTLGNVSGKTAVESPANMRVENGQAFVTIVWNSSNYDYVKWQEQTYTTVNAEGNSTFEIPLSVLDWSTPIVVNSTALGTPQELDYTICFHAKSIQKVE